MQDPTLTFSSGTAFFYHEARKWFTLTSMFITPALLVINAPFGRFTPENQSSVLLIDGIKSWMVMELVAPLSFIYAFLTSPLTTVAPPLSSLSRSQAILALCFLAHYANRALISPLRTPSRSKAHIIIPMCGVFFNVINGSLMGSYLSSPFAWTYFDTCPQTPFYVGLALWGIGFAGNIIHDEMLLNIRKKAKSKGKGKAEAGEHYAIPHGGLYPLISYPNYFCEWIEWLGFAIAAAPFPFSFSFADMTFSSLIDPRTYVNIINTPAHLFAPSLSPPWIFLISEILLMLPRAYKGHQWYRSKFGDTYPENRKAVIPYLL